METQSVLGALAVIWLAIGLLAFYNYSSFSPGDRRRGFLTLLLGVIATVAVLGVGEEITIMMSQLPVSRWLGIGAAVLFGLMMIDCLRGIRRNGVKPLALVALVAVFVVIAASFIST